MQREIEQRSGALGFKLQTDGLHGMSPRSVQGFMQHQAKLHQPVTDLLNSKISATPARPATVASNSRASPGRQAAMFTHAASAGALANTSPDRSRLQAANSSGWLPKLPLAAASAPPAAPTAAVAGVLHESPAGSRSPGMSPRGHAKWHVPYKFSTPLEKQLQKQLEACKRDPAQRAALEARVKTYEDADQPAMEAREALLAANKMQAVTLTADVRIQALQQEAKARQERSKQVLQQHQQREQEQLAAKLAAVQRSDNIKQRRLQEEAEREAHNLQIFQSKHWSGVVASTVCIKELLATVRQMQRFKEISTQQESAVITIQSYWRGHLARKDYHCKQQAVRILQAAFRRHLSKNTDCSSRQKLAAQCVLRFLIDFHGQSHLKLAVKHVQRAVLRDVRLSKQLNLLRTAQHILLTNQWIAMEAKMLALARKRAGADVILAPSKSIKQAKSGLAAQLASRQKGTAVAADSLRRKTTDEVAAGQSSSASSSSGPVGPTPPSCHVTDRSLLEDLEPTPLRLKGLLAQVYIKMKAKHYIRVIGLHWKDKAAYKRKHRAEMNLAAARNILHGAATHEAAAARSSSRNSNILQPNELCVQPSSTAVVPVVLDGCDWVCPTLVPFRATATLKELDVLMQQAAAEAPYYEAVLARQNLDEYMAKLEQQLAARKQGRGSSTNTAPRQQQQQEGNSNNPGDSARETLQRMEACLTRRFVLANINLTDGLTKLPATCQADWDDVTLSKLIYKS